MKEQRLFRRKNLGILLISSLLLFFLVITFSNISANAEETERAEMESYKVYTYRDASMGVPPDGTSGTNGCHVVIKAKFSGTLTLTDKKAAADSFQLADKTSVILTSDFSVSAEGNTLILDMGASMMPGGILQFKGTVIDGLLCDGKPVYWRQEFRTVVPTGLSFHVKELTMGTLQTPASTTIQIDSSAVIRSMNHILWTSNGSSIMEGTGTAQTSAAHHHEYWNFTLEDSAKFIADGGKELSSSGYTVSYQGDTVTITARKPKEGEYLGVYSYDDTFLQEYGIGLEDRVENLPAQVPEKTLDLSKRCIVTLPAFADWTGNPLEPKIVVTDRYKNGVSNYVLKENQDYEVVYENNIDWKSDALVTVKGLGDYAGSFVQKTFRITKPLDMSMFNVDTSEETFTGSAFLKKVTSPEGLQKNTDYTVSYKDNTYPGTAVITVTGKGNYTGVLTWNFTILANASAGNTGQKPAAGTNPVSTVSKSKKMKKAKITKLTAKKGRLKVCWSFVGAKKYKVRYRIKGTKKWKNKTVKNNKVILTKLKRGKRYQVKITAIKGTQKTTSKVKVSPKIK